MLPPKKPSNISATENPVSNRLDNTRITKQGTIGASDPSLQKNVQRTSTANRTTNTIDDPTLTGYTNRKTKTNTIGTISQVDPAVQKTTPRISPAASKTTVSGINLESGQPTNKILKTTSQGQISENDPYLHKAKQRTVANTISPPIAPTLEIKKPQNTNIPGVIDDGILGKTNRTPTTSRPASSVSINVPCNTQTPAPVAGMTQISDRDPYLHKSIPRNTQSYVENQQPLSATKPEQGDQYRIKTGGIQQVDPALNRTQKQLTENPQRSVNTIDTGISKSANLQVHRADSIRDDDPYLYKSIPRGNQSNATESSNTTEQINRIVTPTGKSIGAIDEGGIPANRTGKYTQVINPTQKLTSADYRVQQDKNQVISGIHHIDERDPYLYVSKTRETFSTPVSISNQEDTGDKSSTGININTNTTISGGISAYRDTDKKVPFNTRTISGTDDPAISQVRNYSFNNNEELRRVVTTSNSTTPTTNRLQSGASVPSEVTTAGPTTFGLNGEQLTTNTIESIVQTPDGTVVIVNTQKDVTVNTYEQIVEQKYITNNLGTDTFGVGLAVGNQYSGVVDPVVKLGFDSTYFTIAQIGTEVAKISLTGISSGSGYSGWSGWSGFSGSTGLQGTSGYSGVEGPPGSPGTSGFSGVTGSPGLSGYSGVAGDPGLPGVSGYSGESGPTGTSGFSGYSGQSFTGDYVSYIQAGTGVSVSGTSGAGGIPIVSIGQPVAITDNVVFQNVQIASGGSLTFQDDIAKAIIAGATIPYSQITAAGKFYTNADALAGYTLTDMKPGDFYYDDVSASIYICIDTGLGYFDLLDLTVRA